MAKTLTIPPDFFLKQPAFKGYAKVVNVEALGISEPDMGNLYHHPTVADMVLLYERHPKVAGRFNERAGAYVGPHHDDLLARSTPERPHNVGIAQVIQDPALAYGTSATAFAARLTGGGLFVYPFACKSIGGNYSVLRTHYYSLAVSAAVQALNYGAAPLASRDDLLGLFVPWLGRATVKAVQKYGIEAWARPPVRAALASLASRLSPDEAAVVLGGVDEGGASPGAVALKRGLVDAWCEHGLDFDDLPHPPVSGNTTKDVRYGQAQLIFNAFFTAVRDHLYGENVAALNAQLAREQAEAEAAIDASIAQGAVLKQAGRYVGSLEYGGACAPLTVRQREELTNTFKGVPAGATLTVGDMVEDTLPPGRLGTAQADYKTLMKHLIFDNALNKAVRNHGTLPVNNPPEEAPHGNDPTQAPQASSARAHKGKRRRRREQRT